MKKRISVCVSFVAVLFVATLLFTGHAGALSTPDFSDVPPTHWAYETIMEMTDVGIIKGVGNGQFAPEESLTVGSFLALVGRAMYPSDCNEAGTPVWWETYYVTAINKGIIQATELIESDMDRGITRNEMARILVRVDELVASRPAVVADSSRITDYVAVPSEFRYSVEQAYTKGLLTGNEHGNFNGGNTLRRDEAATVIQRLLAIAETPLEPLQLDLAEISLSYGQMNDIKSVKVLNGTGTITWASSDESVATVNASSTTHQLKWYAQVKAVGSGTCIITATDEDGRVAACVVSSSYEVPEPAPRTGEMVTITFTGWVSYWDFTRINNGGRSSEFFPAGVQMTMKTEDGRALGTTVSYAVEIGDDGYPKGNNYTMVATFDKADLKLDQPDKKAFFMECTYVDENGVRYSSIGKASMRGKGFVLYSDDFHQVRPYDFTGSTINFSMGNSDGEFLDF